MTFALSTIAFSVAAQQSHDQRSDEWESLRLAQAKPKCPSVHVNLPHKVSTDELQNKLSKSYKWDASSVAHAVGQFNDSVSWLEKKLQSPTCDSTLTQTYVQQLITNYTNNYNRAVTTNCQHPLKS